MDGRGPVQGRELLLVGGIAAWASVGLLVVQLVVFVIWPPVHTVPELFDLLHASPVIGLLSLGVLYLINNALVLLFYLGLAAHLWHVSPSRVVLVVILGTIANGGLLRVQPGGGNVGPGQSACRCR
ncbi:hypothetical protein GWK18_00990 [Kocuria sp. JC486]|uniref:hypothetical protein n=1 Tax=Kocuria sp. JC486 TaxID=1970736 RepID=UPI001422173E|nr:hypothetical protein [Kocuria sp. JC486]NHU84190.1 hypothetical protein [Kocuria sp. JC486]